MRLAEMARVATAATEVVEVMAIGRDGAKAAEHARRTNGQAALMWEHQILNPPTGSAVKALPTGIDSDADSASFAARWWPMPLTRFDFSMNKVKLAEITARRQSEFYA